MRQTFCPECNEAIEHADKNGKWCKNNCGSIISVKLADYVLPALKDLLS